MGHGRGAGKDGRCRAQRARGSHARPSARKPKAEAGPPAAAAQQTGQDQGPRQPAQASVALGRQVPGAARPRPPAAAGEGARPGGRGPAVLGPGVAGRARQGLDFSAKCSSAERDSRSPGTLPLQPCKRRGRSRATPPAPRPGEQFPGPAPTPTQTLAGTAEGLGLTRRGVLGPPS